MRRHVNRQPLGRTWRVWDLDAETRYWPIVDALPASELPVCEIGSGAAGLASWTSRQIVGVDPGPDDRHSTMRPLPNLRRVVGDGGSIPLEDRSACATVAADTFEHIPPSSRRAVVEEMIRVTAAGGRIVINGPVGPAAAEGDRWLVDALRRRGPLPDWSMWLHEHFENGLPTESEMMGLLRHARVRRVAYRGAMRLSHWRLMHRLAMGDPRIPGRLHPVLLQPLRRAAHRAARPPFYRTVFVAELI